MPSVNVLRQFQLVQGLYSESQMVAAVKVGVLALQGSFREHCVCIEKSGATAVEVRETPEFVLASQHKKRGSKAVSVLRSVLSRVE